MSGATYRDQILSWRSEREESLRRENGWLALCGLYWLKPGSNTLGSAMDCEVQLPDRFPAQLGKFEWVEAGVYFHPDMEFKSLDGIFPDLNSTLTPDVEENPTFIQFEKMTLLLIKRGDRVGIRMWDNTRTERSEHPPRSWYEIDETFRYSGVYNPFRMPGIESFPDVSGDFQDVDVAGTISFEFKNKIYNLIVSQETSDTLFLRFWDESSKTMSYPSGRYMLVKPENQNRVDLDFNFSYNPPCAFTPYATCVFAPPQNRLDFSILAGETYSQAGSTESH